MSPFVLDLPFKHRRRVLSPPHIHYPANVEAVEAFRKRTDVSQSSTDSFNEIVNKWWVAFAIVGTASAILLVIAVLALARCCVRRWKSKETKPNQNMKQKTASDAVKPIIVHLGMRPEPLAPGLNANLSSPPNIMITPATASPSQLKFAHRINMDPDQKLAADEYGYRKSSDSYGESDFGGSEADIARVQMDRVQAHAHDMTHQLSLYHDQDFSHDYADSQDDSQDDEKLDEIDLQSPGELAERTPPGVGTPTNVKAIVPVNSLASRVAAIVSKRPAQNSPALLPVHSKEVSTFDSDYDISSGSADSEIELTDGELSTLALQFPPPSYPSKFRPKISTLTYEGRDKALPPMYQETSDESWHLAHAVPHFAFHRPSRHAAAPNFPERAANSHTGSPTTTLDHHRPRSWSPPTSPVESRLPYELTRVSSHRDLREQDDTSYTSFPYFSTVTHKTSRLNLSSQARARVHVRAQNDARSGSSTPTLGRTGTVSGRYATGHLASETAMQPRRSDVGWETERRKEEEMKSFD